MKFRRHKKTAFRAVVSVLCRFRFSGREKGRLNFRRPEIYTLCKSVILQS
nr:MAG TPA: hypothetical protein [Caudoviricetes sp.]